MAETATRARVKELAYAKEGHCMSKETILRKVQGQAKSHKNKSQACCATHVFGTILQEDIDSDGQLTIR